MFFIVRVCVWFLDYVLVNDEPSALALRLEGMGFVPTPVEDRQRRHAMPPPPVSVLIVLFPTLATVAKRQKPNLTSSKPVK
ncbi:hypothetical protein HanPI659440_Chr11g0411851 [Helianthus annuus]|nr:hypothetical protein HanPI659440_Chr11g0411851 [Helianthus annuus]